MKRLNKIITLVLLCYSCFINCSYATFNVSSIYIEGKGNNIHEAEIKAHHQGMLRAFLLVIDKLGISEQDVEEVAYADLQRLFKVHDIKNIVSDELLYKATVSYDYELKDLNKILLNYGNDKVQEMFYEYLVLPVFKQKDILSLWSSEQEWHKKWSNSRSTLEHAKLLYPKPFGVIKSKITSSNVLSLKYEDFINLFPELLIKKVLLIVCEYFTDIQTGATVMEVKHIVVSDNGRNLITKSYPLHSLDEVRNKTTMVLENTINEYGRVNVSHSLVVHDGDSKLIFSQPVAEDDTRAIIFDLEAFSAEELDNVKAKLQKIPCIENWKIVHDYKEKYKVTIFTKVDDYKLAEELYLNKLSFKVINNLYFLINVITEGN